MRLPRNVRTAAPPAFARGWPRGILISVLALIGLAAAGAGFGFIGDPDGTNVGIPQEWLSASPFDDYFVPGIVLFVLGLLYLGSAVREWQRAQDAWFWAGLSGGAMIVWIAFQAIWMGSFRHPIQTTLQAIVLLCGAVSGILAIVQLRSWRRVRTIQEAPDLR